MESTFKYFTALIGIFLSSTFKYYGSALATHFSLKTGTIKEQTPLGSVLFPWDTSVIMGLFASSAFYNFNRFPWSKPLWKKKKKSAERSKSIISSYDQKSKVSVQELLKLRRDSQKKIGVSISYLFAHFTKGL